MSKVICATFAILLLNCTSILAHQETDNHPYPVWKLSECKAVEKLQTLLNHMTTEYDRCDALVQAGYLAEKCSLEKGKQIWQQVATECKPHFADLALFKLAMLSCNSLDSVCLSQITASIKASRTGTWVRELLEFVQKNRNAFFDSFSDFKRYLFSLSRQVRGKFDDLIIYTLASECLKIGRKIEALKLFLFISYCRRDSLKWDDSVLAVSNILHEFGFWSDELAFLRQMLVPGRLRADPIFMRSDFLQLLRLRLAYLYMLSGQYDSAEVQLNLVLNYHTGRLLKDDAMMLLYLLYCYRGEESAAFGMWKKFAAGWPKSRYFSVVPHFTCRLSKNQKELLVHKLYHVLGWRR